MIHKATAVIKQKKKQKKYNLFRADRDDMFYSYMTQFYTNYSLLKKNYMSKHIMGGREQCSLK